MSSRDQQGTPTSAMTTTRKPGATGQSCERAPMAKRSMRFTYETKNTQKRCRAGCEELDVRVSQSKSEQGEGGNIQAFKEDAHE